MKEYNYSDYIMDYANDDDHNFDYVINYTMGNPTYFSAPLYLISKGSEKYKLPYEGWPCPKGISFGHVRDDYYAELWWSSMFWNTTYWLIETVNFNEPIVVPLVVFDPPRNEDKFNRYDFEELIYDIMIMRRMQQCSNITESKTDYSLLYVRLCHPSSKVPGLYNCYMLHNSQTRVDFLLNVEYIKEKLSKCGDPLTGPYKEEKKIT